MWASVVFLIFGAICSADEATREMNPNSLRINTVRIQGVERIVELNPLYRTPGGLAELEKTFAGDGLDELVFLMPDSTLWIAYGKHINLYSKSAGRVTAAYAGSALVGVLIIDDENSDTQYRPPMGRRMFALLVLIVAAGLAGGVFFGLIARRNLTGLGRDPLIDRALYGLILGVLAMLLVYGLSNRTLDFRRMVSGISEQHLHRYMLNAPPD